MRGIKLAKNIGFCLGVRRAIDIVEATLSKNKGRIYSLGPVIHNPEVIKQLEKKGLCVVKSLDNLKEPATLILPSHGTARNILKTAKKKKLRLIDLTCPYVSFVQKTCGTLHRQGLEIVIIGNRRHPEIKALLDLAPGAHTIDKITDTRQNLFSYKKIGIISQTTQAQDMFFEMVNKILEKNPLVKEVHIYNTICLDTCRRQEEAGQLAESVDVLLIVGSRLSANTKRLLSIGRKINKRTYLVENKGTPLDKILKNADKVGLISGASTPQWLVEDIVRKINSRKEKTK